MGSDRPKTRRAEEMERLLRRGERRGLSLAELSAETAIPRGTLAWWRHQLGLSRPANATRPRSKPRPAGDAAFVEIVPTAESTSEPHATPSTTIALELRCGRRLLLPADVSADRLQSLVRAVESC